MTDFKNLCVDLVDALTAHGQPDDAAVGYVAGLLTRARAALAEPEPEGPTDEEILQLSVDHDVTYSLAEGEFCTPWQDGYNMRKEVVSFAWAVLARWGNYPVSPDSSTPQPIPVTERLPGPEDGDAEGKCWCWCPPTYAGLCGCWTFAPLKWAEEATHWLPADAIPAPRSENV